MGPQRCHAARLDKLSINSLILSQSVERSDGDRNQRRFDDDAVVDGRKKLATDMRSGSCGDRKYRSRWRQYQFRGDLYRREHRPADLYVDRRWFGGLKYDSQSNNCWQRVDRSLRAVRDLQRNSKCESDDF